MQNPVRIRQDACPGVFAPHDAADGAVARVRLPGGRLSGAQLAELAAVAEALGDGELHLTSRGNLQLRGLDRADGRLGDRLSAAGLLPAPSHERVRNYLASPASAAAGELVAALDRAVCARPELAALPGRFLFAVDDGSGDVAAEGPDVAWRAGAFLIDGEDTGLRVEAEGAVEVLVTAALAFVSYRGDDPGAVWRLRESGEARAAVLDAVADLGSFAEPERFPVGAPIPLGERCVAPRFGCLSGAQARLLAEFSELVVTPWRSIVLPSGAPGSWAEAGFLADPAAPGAGVSACVGRPGCAKAKADVRADAAAIGGRARVHVSGCARRCGKPRGGHVDVLATESGYLVDGHAVAARELANFLKGTA